MTENGHILNRYAWREILCAFPAVFGPSVLAFIISLFFGICLPTQISAQDDPDEALPPPIRIISKDEKARLDSDREVKSRTKLALELMDTRILAAEKELSAVNYDAMLGNLGAFEALMDNHLDFLNRADSDNRRVLDNFKRFEIGLRKFVPRIETIRRELPFQFEQLVRNVGKYLRDARTRALDPLFGDTVVREPRKPN